MSELSGLSLDQAPTISVPLRFFLTAPLFALSSALLLLWQGSDIFDSRWNPAMLAVTHLLTLGYLGIVMIGAILQMLPVVAGTPMRHPHRVATVIHSLVTVGIILLSLGLTFNSPLALRIALPMIGIALLLFAVLVLITLHRALPQNMTARAMRFAAIMLVATVLLGLTLLSNYAFGWWLPDRELLVNLHLTWGLLGWVGILIMGTAYQVVPMFQLTPSYPARLTRWLALAIFCLLFLLAPATQSPAMMFALKILLATGFAIFALTTLWLQSKRRRKLPDVSLNFWRVGLISLLLAIVLWITAQIVPSISLRQSYGMLLGILMIVGFAMSVINGMLYKIVPFLVWFHLQSKHGKNGIAVPNVREILPEPRTRWQMWLHFAALVALVAVAIFPVVFTYPATLLFASSNLLLWLNIITSGRTYRKINTQQINTPD